MGEWVGSGGRVGGVEGEGLLRGWYRQAAACTALQVRQAPQHIQPPVQDTLHIQPPHTRTSPAHLRVVEVLHVLGLVRGPAAGPAAELLLDVQPDRGRQLARLPRCLLRLHDLPGEGWSRLSSRGFGGCGWARGACRKQQSFPDTLQAAPFRRWRAAPPRRRSSRLQARRRARWQGARQRESRTRALVAPESMHVAASTCGPKPQPKTQPRHATHSPRPNRWPGSCASASRSGVGSTGASGPPPPPWRCASCASNWAKSACRAASRASTPT